MSKCEICGRELGLNEDHRDCVIRDYAKCIEDLEQLQNQKAIECLKEVKKWLDERYSFIECCMTKYAQGCFDTSKETIELIDTKIKELEGEKE